MTGLYCPHDHVTLHNDSKVTSAHGDHNYSHEIIMHTLVLFFFRSFLEFAWHVTSLTPYLATLVTFFVTMLVMTGFHHDDCHDL